MARADHRDVAGVPHRPDAPDAPDAPASGAVPDRAWTTGRIARAALAVSAVAALLVAAWLLRGVLLLVFAGALVAVVLDAAAGLGRRAGLSRGAALAAAVTVAAAAAVAAAWSFGSEAGAQLRELAERLPDAWDALRERLARHGAGARLSGWLEDAMPGTSTVLSTVQAALAALVAGVADLLLVLVAAVYFAARPDVYRRGLLLLAPAGMRPVLGDALDDCAGALRLWLRGQFVAMLVVGATTSLGLWWLGVPSALALGLLAGLLDFVPIVGPIVAAVPAVVVASTQGLDVAAGVALLFVVVQQIEGNVLLPLIQQRAVEVPAALLLFAILAAGVLLGGLGVVLAAPLAVVGFVLVKRLYVREALGTPTPIPGESRRAD